jgi:hypothetical protein
MASTFIGCRVAVGVEVTVGFGVTVGVLVTIGGAGRLGVAEGIRGVGWTALAIGSAGRASIRAVQPTASIKKSSINNEYSVGYRIIFIFTGTHRGVQQYYT